MSGQPGVDEMRRKRDVAHAASSRRVFGERQYGSAMSADVRKQASRVGRADERTRAVAATGTPAMRSQVGRRRLARSARVGSVSIFQICSRRRTRRIQTRRHVRVFFV